MSSLKQIFFSYKFILITAFCTLQMNLKILNHWLHRFCSLFLDLRHWLCWDSPPGGEYPPAVPRLVPPLRTLGHQWHQNSGFHCSLSWVCFLPEAHQDWLTPLHLTETDIKLSLPLSVIRSANFFLVLKMFTNEVEHLLHHRALYICTMIFC